MYWRKLVVVKGQGPDNFVKLVKSAEKIVKVIPKILRK